jgi:osmotically-inducible protein OsmY
MPLKKETQMNIKNPALTLVISMLLAAGLAACDSNPGPAASAGQKIDEVAAVASEKVEQTTADASKSIGETADKVGAVVGEQTAKAEVAVNDAEITTRIKGVIFETPGLKTLQISVDTVNGVVALTGNVDTQEQIDTAGSLATSVTGVKEVKNNLLVKPS